MSTPSAVLMSLAAFAVQSVVDNLSNLPFVILIVVVLVAWVDARLSSMTPASDQVTDATSAPRPRWLDIGILVPIASLAAIALVIPTLQRADGAAALSRQGGEAALRGHWLVALDGYQAAMTADPGFTLYEIQAAGALARVGRSAEARDLLAHAVESDPVALNVIGLAALEAELGNRDAALARVAQARTLGIGEPTVALNAGLIAERLGVRDLALDAFADAVAWDPPLASAALWSSPPSLMTKAEVIVEARSRVDELEGALIDAYGGAPADARAALEMLPPSTRRDVYMAVATWYFHEPTEAVSRLEALLRRDPSDWYAAAWAARIGRISGMPDILGRYSKWAIALQGDGAPMVISEAAKIPAGFDLPTAALPGNYNWAVYLRPIAGYLHQDALVVIGQR
jgi:tetratricopeptide (TPR) repeat protein